jgi:hypothetical protein
MAELRISSFLQDDEEREDEEEEKEDSDDEIGDEVEGNDEDKSLNPAERRSFCTFMKKRAGRLKDEEKNSKSTSTSLKSSEDFLTIKLFYKQASSRS